MDTVFKIIEHGSNEWEKAVILREEILRKPLGSFFNKEELDEEKNHIQIIALLKNEIVGTAVLVPERKHLKMQRVVVSAERRNANIGSEMMLFCESYALNAGYKSIYCHARDTAVNFYLKNEYAKDGDYFDEDGIPHLKMKKQF